MERRSLMTRHHAPQPRSHVLDENRLPELAGLSNEDSGMTRDDL
jgi:hypothetical protein